jgi:hypothetical protein
MDRRFDGHSRDSDVVTKDYIPGFAEIHYDLQNIYNGRIIIGILFYGYTLYFVEVTATKSILELSGICSENFYYYYCLFTCLYYCVFIQSLPVICLWFYVVFVHNVITCILPVLCL